MATCCEELDEEPKEAKDSKDLCRRMSYKAVDQKTQDQAGAGPAAESCVVARISWVLFMRTSLLDAPADQSPSS